MKNVLISAVLTGFLLLGGCGQPEQMVSSDPVCIPGASADQAMQAAQKVLTGMQFSIEKYDFDARYIRTRPLSGAQFFQVFRGDNASSYAATEANIYSLRRTVEMEITPMEKRTCLECRVYVQQLSIPERPLTGTTRMAGNYTDSSQSWQSLRLDNDQLENMEWLDRGLDRALEQKIVGKIKAILEKE